MGRYHSGISNLLILLLFDNKIYCPDNSLDAEVEGDGNSRRGAGMGPDAVGQPGGTHDQGAGLRANQLAGADRLAAVHGEGEQRRVHGRGDTTGVLDFEFAAGLRRRRRYVCRFGGLGRRGHGRRCLGRDGKISANHLQQPQPVAKGHAQFLQIIFCQIGKNIGADVVVDEGITVFAEPQVLQPNPDVLFQDVPCPCENLLTT